MSKYHPMKDENDVKDKTGWKYWKRLNNKTEMTEAGDEIKRNETTKQKCH